MSIPWLGKAVLWICKLILRFSSALQKSQCFTFDDEEREERKVGMFFGFLFLLDNEIYSSELVSGKA